MGTSELLNEGTLEIISKDSSEPIIEVLLEGMDELLTVGTFEPPIKGNELSSTVGDMVFIPLVSVLPFPLVSTGCCEPPPPLLMLNGDFVVAAVVGAIELMSAVSTVGAAVVKVTTAAVAGVTAAGVIVVSEDAAVAAIVDAVTSDEDAVTVDLVEATIGVIDGAPLGDVPGTPVGGVDSSCNGTSLLPPTTIVAGGFELDGLNDD